MDDKKFKEIKKEMELLVWKYVPCTIEWDIRMTFAYGKTLFRSGNAVKIKFSPVIVSLGTKENGLQVALHEVSHYLVNGGHNREFYRMFRKLLKENGFNYDQSDRQLKYSPFNYSINEVKIIAKDKKFIFERLINEED